MALEIRPLALEEAALFNSDDEKDQEHSCIGHLRGDFGYNGKEFWHSWFGRQDALNTPEFKADLAAVITGLRTQGPLKDLRSMAYYCCGHREAKIPGALHPETYGFCVNTDQYRYYIRCFPLQGDYKFHVHCYKKGNERLWEKTGGRQIRSAPSKKRHGPER